MALRRAQPGDLDAVLAFQEAAFDDERRPPGQETKRFLGSREEQVWLLKSAAPDRLDGMVILRRLGVDLHVRDLSTHPDARGQGVGGKLLAHAEATARKDGAKTLTVEAEEQDPRLVAWYEGHGFVRVERIVDFFHDGCSAIRLRKEL